MSTSIQSVFLADIAKAYEKTPKLESLLFDDFFNKGKSLAFYLAMIINALELIRPLR